MTISTPSVPRVSIRSAGPSAGSSSACDASTIASVGDAGRPDGRQIVRRSLVLTIVATPANLGLYLIGFLALGLGLGPLTANVLAGTAVSVPAYVASRRWIWRFAPSSAADAWGRGVVYWLSTMANLGVATIALALLERGGARDAVLAVAPLAVYSALWVARLGFLDRVLFRRR